MKKLLPFLLPLILLVGLAWMFIQSKNKAGVYKQLPVLGNHRLDTLKSSDGTLKIDTVFHSIPSFRLVNQNKDTVTNDAVKGKVYVADYFFTTCQSICPIMSKQLDRVYAARPEVMILSHTVDPETDSAETLHKYVGFSLRAQNPNCMNWLGKAIFSMPAKEMAVRKILSTPRILP
jgi:protein SCO1/2